MKLLSLRLCEHDSNFSYFDGESVHYYKSERSTQIKHHAFNNLTQWKEEIQNVFGISHEELDDISIIIDPWLYNLPPDNENFFPSINYNKHFLSNCNVDRINHHYAHALSTWMIDDTEYDYAFIIDGFGDFDIAWSVFDKNGLVCSGSKELNGSIGIEMSMAAKMLGINSPHQVDNAGKLMGLQAYGKFNQGFYDSLEGYNIKNIKELFDQQNYHNYINDKLLSFLTPLDWINTIHKKVGDIILDFFKQYAAPSDKIVYCGGVAQNVIWNTKLKEYFPNMIIPPHCADDGLSLGGLEYLRLKHKLPKFKIKKFPYAQSDVSPENKPSIETIKVAAKMLSEGYRIGWYQENGEIGPRALGNRSILMDPRIDGAREIINKIKNREQYRPFGASILEEHSDDYFPNMPKNPYMLYVGNFNEENEIASISHKDKTCRAQTVSKDSKDLSDFRILLEEFYNLTNCPIVLNTSLNVGGKPLAGYPENALELFNNSDLDALFVGNTIYTK
jgi:carbamoyltransferase